MKPYFAFFLIFFILGFAESSRLDKNYWNHVMGEETMPAAIQNLLPVTYLESQDPVNRSWDDLINRDFDTSSTAIIYHHHDGQMKPAADQHNG